MDEAELTDTQLLTIVGDLEVLRRMQAAQIAALRRRVVELEAELARQTGTVDSSP